jgi:hypothetical protein
MKRSKARARLASFARWPLGAGLSSGACGIGGMGVVCAICVVACGGAFGTACRKDTVIETRAVAMHVPSSCALGSDKAYGLFVASGDFDPVVSDGVRLADVGAGLTLPQNARALVVDVSSGDAEWRGVRDVGASGNVDVLLLPFQATCALSGDVELRSATTLGVLDPSRMLVLGGVGGTSGGDGGGAGSIPDTFLADLSTGITTRLAAGLLTPRTRTTVTPFGRGGLVAGGARGDGSLIDSAEVFVAGASGGGDFDRAPILLSAPRGDHGAVVLVTGETLLVGGLSAAGGAPLSTLEIVDPKARGARTQGLTQLEVPRTKPVVMRLASGEVLVAGGFDAASKPVTTLEWLTPDGRGHARHSRELVARKERGFVALPAGGALAVIAPDAGDVGLQNVWVISADGEPEHAEPIAGALTSVRLFAGADGKPLLWTGDRWLQWSPWFGAFGALGALANAGPGPKVDAIASPDLGLAMWLDGASLVALRFATPTAYETFPLPLLSQGSQGTNAPAHLAPDRLVSPGAATSLQIDSDLGLVLTAGASAFVTDATYGAVTLDLEVPTGEPPLVVLRDESGNETAIGGDVCPFAIARGAPASVHVERDGAKLRVAAQECAAVGASLEAAARVTVGFRGAPGEGRSVARNVRIVRR